MKKGVTNLDLPVVGMKFRVTASTRRMIAAHVEEGTVECDLIREPTNHHDENAVKVVISTKPYAGFHIGYVPAEIAAKLAPVLDTKTAKVTAAVLTEMDADDATAMVAVALKTPAVAKKKKSR